NTVTNNKIVAAKYGIRISVGSANNTITNNKVKNSTLYGIFMYKGTNSVTYTTPSGHPTANILRNNAVTSTVANAVWLT
ncbi:hypothetical protein ACQ7B2_01755, partial [Escherichia coli]